MGQFALPDGIRSSTGWVDRDGVRVAYDVSGTGNLDVPTVLLLPTWSIAPSQFWKAQVPYLARHYRVVTFDGRGSGDSGRPGGAAAYTNKEYAADALAVLDATGTERAVVVGLSCGASWAVHLAADHPDRVSGVLAVGPSCGFDLPSAHRDAFSWGDRLTTADGWAKYNKHYWLEGGYGDFTRFFFGQMFPEPHSTKQVEDCVGWASEISPQTLAFTTAGRLGVDGATCERIEPYCERVRCPVLVIHGTDDRIRSHSYGQRLAELTEVSCCSSTAQGTGSPLATPCCSTRRSAGSSTASTPGNTVGDPAGDPAPVAAAARPPRALYLSSPIGLGHARRDLAIARELRLQHPDLQVDWLAQDPVTRVLDEAGEAVHPASRWLASESAHVERECGEHDLHAFGAIRRMDAILANNFGVFRDLLEEEPYDLVVADEAWDVDYFLHENPWAKRAPLAWMTDFVGWLPMPEGGASEAALTADYNAEMVEQRVRFPSVRDRSVFVGSACDLPDASLGAGLPQIRDWTTANFDYAGYVTGFDAVPDALRPQLRADLGYRPEERVCVVTVGGSGVGLSLLRRVLDAAPLVRRGAPDMRFVVVAGPRIDAGSLPSVDGVEVCGFLPDLLDHLAVCDVAVVQGGLSTCMELTANRRPFVYVPLQRHFEQNLHVRHRLEGYGAGTCLPYDLARDPDRLAAAVLAELDRVVAYKPVETGGAARAASLIGELL